MAFDQRLRRGFSHDEIAGLEGLLGRLDANVANVANGHDTPA